MHSACAKDTPIASLGFILMPYFVMLLSPFLAGVHSNIQQIKAKVTACDPEVVRTRRLLSGPEVTPSKTQCLAGCFRDDLCYLAVYHVAMSGGQKMCTKYSVDGVAFNTDLPVTLADDQTCAMLEISLPQCQEAVALDDPICLCPPGQTCGSTSPSPCDTFNLHSDEHLLIGDASSIIKQLFSSDAPYQKDWKIRVFDYSLNARSVYKVDTFEYNPSSNLLEIKSVRSLLKKSWDRFDPNAGRILYEFKAGVGYSQIRGYTAFPALSDVAPFERATCFTLLLSKQSRFREKLDFVNAPVASEQALLIFISKGYDVQNLPVIRSASSKPILESGFQDFRVVNASHSPTVSWHMYKYPFAGDFQHMYVPLFNPSSISIDSEPFNLHKAYVDPDWREFGDRTSLPSDSGKSGLNSLLESGHRFRMNVHGTLISLTSVLRTGNEYRYVLDSMVEDISAGPYAGAATLMLKMFVNLIGGKYWCARAPESGIRAWVSGIAKRKYTLFADTRAWTKLFQVFSNSSVSHGDVTHLAQAVLSGSDVNVWVHWLNQEVDEFFVTQVNTVSAQGHVSSESKTLWRQSPVIPPNLGFDGDCGFKKILVTSQGHMEVMEYDIKKAGKVTTENDVMITWFLN